MINICIVRTYFWISFHILCFLFGQILGQILITFISNFNQNKSLFELWFQQNIEMIKMPRLLWAPYSIIDFIQVLECYMEMKTVKVFCKCRLLATCEHRWRINHQSTRYLPWVLQILIPKDYCTEDQANCQVRNVGIYRT